MFRNTLWFSDCQCKFRLLEPIELASVLACISIIYAHFVTLKDGLNSCLVVVQCCTAVTLLLCDWILCTHTESKTCTAQTHTAAASLSWWSPCPRSAPLQGSLSGPLSHFLGEIALFSMDILSEKIISSQKEWGRKSTISRNVEKISMISYNGNWSKLSLWNKIMQHMKGFQDFQVLLRRNIFTARCCAQLALYRYLTFYMNTFSRIIYRDYFKQDICMPT